MTGGAGGASPGALSRSPPAPGTPPSPPSSGTQTGNATPYRHGSDHSRAGSPLSRLKNVEPIDRNIKDYTDESKDIEEPIVGYFARVYVSLDPLKGRGLLMLLMDRVRLRL